VPQLEKVRTCRGTLAARDPLGNYCGVLLGDTLEVLATRDFATVATFAGASAGELDADARRLVVRDGHALEIRDAARTLARVATPTRTMRWNGRPVDPGEAAPRHELADEHFGFTADGAHVWLAAHGEDGRACVLLYDAELQLRDTFRDLRSYSPYSDGPQPYLAWSESRFHVQPHDPEWILGACNAGDSCAAAFALRVEAHRLVVVQEELQKAIFDVDAYFLRYLGITPRRELLMMDSDSNLSVLAWPPVEGRVRVERASPTRHLRDEDHRIALPFCDAEDLDVVGWVSTTATHVVVGVESDDATVGLVMLDVESLAPRALVRSPTTAAYLDHLGGDRFAAKTSNGRVSFYRLDG
jgi:hypothetical protein